MRRGLAAAALALAVVAGVARPAVAKRAPDVDQPADFVRDAERFHQLVACAGEPPTDPAVAKAIASHCRQLDKLVRRYRERYVEPAGALLATLRPAGLPTAVVYPFGGGDLLTALLTFPDATEITTLSLEQTGDPTRLAGLSPRQLRTHLDKFRKEFAELLRHSDSASESLKTLQQGPIPGQLGFFLASAAIHGWRPIGMRYFELAADGAVRYLTRGDLARLSERRAKRKKKSWVDPDWSVAFANVELRLARVDDPSRQLVHRHLAVNLDNDHFPGSPVAAHLAAKGKVAAMTKAASYLLWMRAFSGIRDYLVDHLAWMISDTTGLPPSVATAAGFEQETHGWFDGPMFRVNRAYAQEYVELFAAQPLRRLGFRYGYRDSRKRPHLVITRPRAAGAAAGGPPR
jgi:hypothetical protein